MSFFAVKGASRRIRGRIQPPGDKSIASRSIIISAISRGRTAINNFPSGNDPLQTIKTFKNLGIEIKRNQASKAVIVFGKGLYGLKKPRGALFMGDSGTTFRLTLGVLAGQDFAVTLTADRSLSRRPMRRVTEPLRMMGAAIKSRSVKSGTKTEEYPPVTIRGSRHIEPISYKLRVASAQVKSAILLAGLYAKGATCLIEPFKTRDHTERMLKLFKADIKPGQRPIVIKGKRGLVSPRSIYIPGDISSASFFMVMAAIIPGSRILIKNVSLNPSRGGIIRVLKRMGSDMLISGRRRAGFEDMGDITAKSSDLKGTVIAREEIPSLIDELPVLMVAACFASGESVFEGVEELRAKETDRIISMSRNLKKMGADIRVVKSRHSEKIVIKGGIPLKGAKVSSFGDHRTAMSMVVAALGAEGTTYIDNISCINKSFPGFLGMLKAVLS